MFPPIPPLLIATLGLLGAAVLVRQIIKDRKRVNSELERVRAQGRAEQEPRATLRRDPRTGVYRP